VVSFVDKAAIISLHMHGISNRQIAKQVGMNRKTIDVYVKQYEADKRQLEKADDIVEISKIQTEMYQRKRMNVSARFERKFTGALAKRFYELIALDEMRNARLGTNKQQVNGAILHRRLLMEGYDIGSSVIRAKFSEYRNGHREVFIKQDYEYGDRVEFDFHQIKVLINDEVKRFHQATISCPKSNFIFIRLYESEKTISVLTALVEFFRYCGGVFNEVTFDNLKPVVKTYGYKNAKQLSDEIVKFSTYYGFKVNTCNARKGNEKGHVENSGKHVRSNLFSLNYTFFSPEELKKYVEDSILTINSSSVTSFNEEVKHLKPLPVHDYNLGQFGIGMVNTYSFILIETNFYSVPERYVGQEIRYSIINDLVVLYAGNLEIARHRKVAGQFGYRLEIRHYLETLKRKPGAITRSLALKQADEAMVATFKHKYQDDPKGFIEYLHRGKTMSRTGDSSIESVAYSQLKQINATYNLRGVLNNE
jgi:hypothetical protein